MPTLPGGHAVCLSLAGSHHVRMSLASTLTPYPAQIRLLREIASLSGLPFEDKLQRLLSKTADLLGLDLGFFSHIEGETYTVRAIHPAGGATAVGDTFRLGETYCDLTVRSGDVVMIDEMRTSRHADHDCYGALGLEAYIGAPVHVGDAFYGTLCFASPAPRATAFSEADADLLRLLASWVGTAVERFRAADAARQSERRLAAVLDAAPMAVVLTGPDRTIEYVNPAFEDLFACPAEEAVGQQTRAFYAHPEEYERQGRLRFHAAGSLDDGAYVVEYLRRDGTTFLGETVGGPLSLGGEVTGMLGFIRDVTDREAAREREAAAARAEAEAVRAKERFLANMSHEMRTPLNAVLGLSHLLGETPLTADQAGLVGGVSTAADALLALIDDLLDFARLGAGKLPIEAVPFAPAEVVAEVETLVRPKADAKGLAFRTAVGGAVPDRVLGDPTRFRQILLNLASNAVKFTPAGTVRLALDADGDRLLLEVSDTGVGIPAGRRAAIFDPFVQAADDAARRFGGTGLGLAIVKELVERQGGAISVESVEGEGSTFRVSIPARVPTAPPRPAASAHRADAADLTGVRVLLVEDNPMNRLVARRMLESWGVEVTEACDGNEAVRAVAGMEDAAFDLALMDLQMPEMDGVSATRYIRSELGVGTDALPIVALTASVLASQHEDVLSAGLDDFVLKPFDPDALRALIGAWTDRQPDAPAEADDASGPADDASEPAVDPDELARYTCGDPDLALQVAALFVNGGQETADCLGAALKRKDLGAIERAAHALKGQAGYVGATALHATAERIVAAAREGDRVSAASEVPVALRQFRAAAGELARLYPLPDLGGVEAATA